MGTSRGTGHEQGDLADLATSRGTWPQVGGLGYELGDWVGAGGLGHEQWNWVET